MNLENNAPRYSPDLSAYMSWVRSDLAYMDNEDTDNLKPYEALKEIEAIVCAMIEENVLYVKKNGLTAKAKESRERLLRILHVIEPFNKLYNNNEALKALNKSLLIENQRLKAELSEIKRQENLGNSL